MTTYLHELYCHQEWADAEHWHAFEVHPAALADKAIRERLHHIHLVQSAFLWVVGPRTSQFVIIKVEDYRNMADLKAFAREYHRGVAELLNGMDEKREAEPVEIPWFKPLKISRLQALTQCAMHSHYHRGQTRRACGNWAACRLPRTLLSGYERGNRQRDGVSPTSPV